jgi:cellulose synthase/poly-beta-1,6-N-acetylglucosamine synthase-like glycosyltransferase
LNEDIDILKKTFDAILYIDYPKDKLTIVIGDDGNRLHLQQYIYEHYSHFQYHNRTHIHGHAKAGNLNDILFEQYNGNFKYKGEFVLILDSDMIPESTILKKLLPPFYFYMNDNVYLNPNCAFVQSPQSFYNIKGYDFLGQSYQFFYQIVLKAYSGYELGVPCCGTNVLFHREILCFIGGFQYGSITEDFNTSLLLHHKGYESKYITEITARGMAPLSLIDFFNQRKRWTVGGLQIFFQQYKRIFSLPLVYQWIYGYCSISSLFSIFYLCLFVGPIFDLFYPNTFYCSMNTSYYIFSILPYAYIYLQYLFYLHSHLSIGVFINSIQESIYMIPYQFYYVCVFVCKYLRISKISFTITPKKREVSTQKTIPSLYLLFPFLIYYGWSVYTFIYYFQFFPTKYINFIWILILLFQFYPPIAYLIQNQFKI